MAGAVALASTGYIAAIDEKPGRGHVGSARASRVPHSVSRHCPRRQLESRVREAQGRVILLERGLDRSPVGGPPGQAVVRRTVPLRSLDDWLVPACYPIALPLRFYYDLPKRPPKISGVLSIERNTNILGRPATGRVNFPADRGRSRLKDTPISCDKVARLRSYEIRVGLRTRSLLTAVMVHTGL